MVDNIGGCPDGDYTFAAVGWVFAGCGGRGDVEH
jgi:hypothetical protein